MDYTLPVRRAVMAAMAADTALLALVPAANQYPSTVPANHLWPFTRYGAPTSTPFRLSGLNSSTVRVTIHAFTKPVYVNNDSTKAMLVTAEDRSWLMAAAIESALDQAVLPLGDGMRATLSWIGSNCVVDGNEPTAWHAIVNLSADVAG